MVSGELPADRIPAEVSLLFRRQIYSRVPDGIREETHLPKWRRSCPGGSRIRFCAGPDGRRPVYGGTEKFQQDPHWRDLVLFYEYFHGDNGAGIGASHQTGWTGLVAKLIQQSGE